MQVTFKNQNQTEEYNLLYVSYMYMQGRRYWGCGGGVTPPKIFKYRENSGKLRENSVTSGNICGC